MLRAASTQDFDGELRLTMPDGRTKHVRTAGRRLDEEPTPTFVGAAQDVTELRQREEALNSIRAELAQVARTSALGALSASIVHEVSQPLAGILNNSNACLRMLAARPSNVENAEETVRRTVRDANRATEVVKRLRALFARETPPVEPVDLNEAAREVIALSASEIGRSLISVELRLDDSIPPVRGDRIQLQQVILNLLSNAADAVVDMVGSERHTVMVETSADDRRVILSVRDEGVGFEPGADERIFDAFYTTKKNGIGIGLSVSRSIIENYGGKISASRNNDRGTTISFSIPSHATKFSG
jgi:C4-dicarboxylate-specific signal transduction histidine kinase